MLKKNLSILGSTTQIHLIMDSNLLYLPGVTVLSLCPTGVLLNSSLGVAWKVVNIFEVGLSALCGVETLADTNFSI